MTTETHLLVEDETTPAALKEPVVKELMVKERNLVDKLRQMPTSMTGATNLHPETMEGFS